MRTTECWFQITYLPRLQSRVRYVFVVLRSRIGLMSGQKPSEDVQ